MTSVNTQATEIKESEAPSTAIDTSLVTSIDSETAKAVKEFTLVHFDFLKRTAQTGSLTQRAVAILFLRISGVVQ